MGVIRPGQVWKFNSSDFRLTMVRQLDNMSAEAWEVATLDGYTTYWASTILERYHLYFDPVLGEFDRQLKELIGE
jgi:hypothetical protein